MKSNLNFPLLKTIVNLIEMWIKFTGLNFVSALLN